MNLTRLKRYQKCLKILIVLVGAVLCQPVLAVQKINFAPEDAAYLLTEKETTIDQVKNTPFRKLADYPNILERPQEKSIWIKKNILTKERRELVFDFIRKDFVKLYIFAGDSLIASHQTGFLMPASKKKMGRWNAIDFIFEPNTAYTLFFEINHVINDPDLIILVEERGEWREILLYDMIQDIAFLSVMLIVSIYIFLLFFQNKMKVFLYFSLYLLSVFIFYLYVLDILRDFFISEHPEVTLYCLMAAMFGPVFYIMFTREFLSMKETMPKWDKLYRYLAFANLFMAVATTLHYVAFKDYYFFADVARVCLLTNVGLGILISPIFLRQKSTLVYYFLAGSACMMGGLMIDLVLWTSAKNLGAFAQIGYVLEIIFFSLGLGKKMQSILKDRERAQRSYIGQLEINKQLIEKQKRELEDTVLERTKELQASKEEAERSARVKEEFLSVMSHEIRTPMNAIVGLTHMLPAEDKGEAFTENITTLRYAVDNLMLLINNVLDYNKISAGKVQLEQIDFDLQKIVSSVCHLFKAKADSKGLDFILQLDENLPQYITGDPFRLSQVLNNFLSNAIKFTEKGSIGVDVSLIA